MFCSAMLINVHHTAKLYGKFSFYTVSFSLFRIALTNLKKQKLNQKIVLPGAVMATRNIFAFSTKPVYHFPPTLGQVLQRKLYDSHNDYTKLFAKLTAGFL
jgi:hypothetical protein